MAKPITMSVAFPRGLTSLRLAILWGLQAAFVHAQNDATITPGKPAIIVMDDKSARKEGPWDLRPSKGSHGDGFVFSSGVDHAGPSAVATFKPQIIVGGNYDVEIWYVAGANRSTNMPVVTVHDAGEEQVFVNQRIKGSQWIRVASNKPFSPNGKAAVRIMNNCGTGMIAVADGVRFVPSTGSAISSSAVSSGSTTTSGTNGFRLHLIVESGGRINRTPDLSAYPTNLTVTLTATANPNYVFNGWTIDGSRTVSFRNPLSLPMTRPRKVIAHFLQVPIGVIMDNAEAMFRGLWVKSDHAWPGTRNEDYHLSPSVSKVPTATAEFRPDLPTSGLYDIYIWYPDGPNRAINSTWEIICAEGVFSTQVDQTRNGGTWVLIAAGKKFDEGRKGCVRVNNLAGPASSVVVADAVAFVFAGKP